MQMMTRKFLDRDGYVLEENDWVVRPYDTCFYCDDLLLLCMEKQCPIGFLGLHDWVTICNFQRYKD